jgi:hypothetical protein
MTDKILITTPASAYEVHQAQEAEHIKPNERTRLANQMTGMWPYEPRLGGSGQTLSCKSDSCNNIALGGARKQLCPTHYASFLEKSNAAQLIPRCSTCNSRTRLKFEGFQMCTACRTATEDARNKAAAVMSYDTAKRMELDNVETVHEMREWIKEYML